MEGKMFTTAGDAMKFIEAGDAIFTLVSRTTGSRYTYKAQKPKNSHDPTMRFIRVLTGPDNNNDYTYMGVMSQGQFRLTGKSRLTAEALPVKALDYALAALTQRKEIPSTLEIWHEGRCGRCGRRLTVPSSIEAGIGPECASMMGGM
jgi:Family of unknown function (DUF6011)